MSRSGPKELCQLDKTGSRTVSISNSSPAYEARNAGESRPVQGSVARGPFQWIGTNRPSTAVGTWTARIFHGGHGGGHMDTRRALLVDAFTTEPLTGNPAGIVPESEGLTDEQMQAVAKEFAQSETAFLRPSENADRSVRYFTPTTEVDLCGHATVASHAFLFEDGAMQAGTYTLETNVGVLDIEAEEDGTVWMTQGEPEVRVVEDLEYQVVAEALDIDPAALADVGADLPLGVASTGLSYLMVPVNFLEHVGEVSPTPEAIETLTEAVGAFGVYVFTFDTLEKASTLHARMFAPGAGVSEDPVTGTAAGACAAYLRQTHAFGTNGNDDGGAIPDRMIVEQGDFVDRPGRIRVRVEDAIWVGGRAVTALDGRLAIPDSTSDDIVEI